MKFCWYILLILSPNTWAHGVLYITTCNSFPTLAKEGRCVTRSHFGRWQVMGVFIQSEPNWRIAEWQYPTSQWKGMVWYSQDTLNITHVMVFTCYKFVFDHLMSLLSLLMMACIMQHSSIITPSMQRLLQWCNCETDCLQYWWHHFGGDLNTEVCHDIEFWVICCVCYLYWSYAGHFWKVPCI
jgi:hypothetical protein